MLKLRIFGLDAAVTFGFMFTASLFLLLRSSRECIFAASGCIIHELGHCFAAVILNVKFRSLKLWSGGISIERERNIISYNTELAVLLCGPFFNFCFAAICGLNGMIDSSLINLSLAIFNLFPYSSLDGGCIIKGFFEKYEKNGGYIQKITAVFFGVSILFLCIFFRVKNITLISVIVLLTADELYEQFCVAA